MCQATDEEADAPDGGGGDKPQHQLQPASIGTLALAEPHLASIGTLVSTAPHLIGHAGIDCASALLTCRRWMSLCLMEILVSSVPMLQASWHPLYLHLVIVENT